MRRWALLVAILSFGLLAISGAPARAAFLGSGNTVVITYEFPGGQEIEGNHGAPDTIALDAGGVVVGEGALDGVSITISATQIVFKNFIPAEFCDTAGQHPCKDAFNGFEFQFSSGVDIAGATLDPASASDFLPTGSGINLASSTDLLVDVAGDTPAVNDQLVLDLTFAPVSTPEPMSLAILAPGFAALGLMRRRRSRSDG
jgi:hypothetical protein